MPFWFKVNIVEFAAKKLNAIDVGDEVLLISNAVVPDDTDVTPPLPELPPINMFPF